MLKSSERESSLKKIPIRSPRGTKGAYTPLCQSILVKKYLHISVNAFYFRKTQDYLKAKPLSRQINYIASQEQLISRYYGFEEIKNSIRGIVTERVEKDFLFGITFHAQWRVLERYVQKQRKVKQRNLYNRYYFSKYPPKISLITQPTIATTFSIRAPETNSTIEIKALTRHIDLMLSKQKPNNKAFATPEKKSKKDKSDKYKKKVRTSEELPQESYGLKNYKKDRKSKGRGSDSKRWNVQYCFTPQPHSNNRDRQKFSGFGSEPRMSERGPNSKSKSKKNIKSKSKGR